MNRTLRKPLLVSLLLALAAAPAFALPTVDLTAPGVAGSANGALFTQGNQDPAASETFTPFLQIQRTGEITSPEQSYATGGGYPFDGQPGSGLIGSDLSVSDLVAVPHNGDSYLKVRLDIKQDDNSSLLSLDRLQIYTDALHNVTREDLNPDGRTFPLGTLRYDLGAANWVKLDANAPDTFIYIPSSVFAGAKPSDAVYFYARFGDYNAANGGPETFSVLTASSAGTLPVGQQPLPASHMPEPASLVLLPLSLAALAVRRAAQKR